MSDPSPAPLMVAPFSLDALVHAAVADGPAPDGASPDDAPASEDASTPDGAPTPRTRRRRNARVDRRRSRRRRRWLVAAMVFVLLVGAAAAFVGVQLGKPDPLPLIMSKPLPTVNLAPDSTIVSKLPWPGAGQGAVAVPALGITVAPGTQESVPVASLTKLMTAYVVLHDHPLAVGSPGPNITVTQPDVDDYGNDVVNDDSSVAVKVGEVLTERQVLGGLLVHSADNYADLIARWDAGSEAAFVVKMNATAQSLGMDHSHFADPSGVSPQSESSAQDIVKVAALDMQDPNVQAMVKMQSITLPVAGSVGSYTPMLGVDGIVGVKSGFTSQAGGGDVVAAVRSVHGVPVVLLAAITSQQGPNILNLCAQRGLALIDAAVAYMGTATVLHKGQLIARVASDGRTVTATATESVSMFTWPGATSTAVFRPVRRLTDQAKRGARVGTVVVTMGDQRTVVPVRLTHDVPRPTMMQRIFGEPKA